MEAFKAGTAPGEANAPADTSDQQTTAPGPGATTPSDVGEGTGGIY